MCCLLFTLVLESLNGDEQHDRDQCKRQRDYETIGVLPLLQCSKDVERGRLGLALNAPRHDQDRADFTEGPRSGQCDPIEERPLDVRKSDLEESLYGIGTQGLRG